MKQADGRHQTPKIQSSRPSPEIVAGADGSMTVARGDGSPERLGGALRRLHYKATRRAHSANARHHAATAPTPPTKAKTSSVFAMNSTSTYAFYLLFFVGALRCCLQRNPHLKDAEIFLDVRQRAEKHGYLSSTHTVKTEDGYLLKLFRIQRGSRQKSRPVLIMHGLLQSAAMWIDAGPRVAVAYLLADAGHDVWLGNARGSYYSRQHDWLNPDTDSQFWQFSADEIGYYDLPACIDYILSETNALKINYIGFSQGGGIFFIMCSERPEYRDKVNGAIGIAPSSRHLHTKSIIFRTICEYFQTTEDVLNENGVWEVLTKGSIMQLFLQMFCTISEEATSICEALKDFIDAPNQRSVNRSTIRVAFAGFPAGTSVHNMARFGQMIKSKSFLKYDHGPDRNLVVYGRETPPVYNLSAVTVPTVIIYGNNDGIVDSRDVKWLVRKLPNVLEVFEVRDPFWSHFDVQMSRNIPKLLFPKVKECLDKFS